MEEIVHSNHDNCVEEVLPGFRFHPTDEELVGFYLRRKVEKKPVRIELIKQIDIYKHDPWDLPKSTVGEKEMYFYCVRGRKYRNSIRPNRVTGSGYWKATGIDRPIYDADGENHVCLGLKKSLVYYRGSAGKGTITDWMMHEFRLPSSGKSSTNMIHEAEMLTLCRIFKRNGTQKRHTHEETSSMKQNSNDPSSRTWSTDSDTGEIHQNSLNISQISEGKVSNSSQLHSHISYAVSSPSLSILNHGELLFEDMLDDLMFVDY